MNCFHSKNPVGEDSEREKCVITKCLDDKCGWIVNKREGLKLFKQRKRFGDLMRGLIFLW